MADNIYIEEQWDENYYFKLTTSGLPNTDVPWASIDNLVGKEKLDSGSPTLSVRFIDSAGVLMSSTHIEPQHPFDFSLGIDADNRMSGRVALSEYRVSEMASGQTGNVYIDVDFVTDKWRNLFNKCHSRSWGRVRKSDVISQIAEEVGFDDISIEPTDKQENIIQPNWTNIQMLRWLINSAISHTGMSGYYMGTTLDGQFFAKTLDTLMNQRPTETIVISPISLDGGEDNNTHTALAYDFHHRYVGPLTKGAAGVKAQYFDWFNKEFHSDELTVSGSDHRQLSEWYYIAEKDETVPICVNAGRSQTSDDTLQGQVVKRANNMMKVNLTVSGDHEFHIGQLVNLLVVPSEEFDIDVSKIYSGYYLITEVAQHVLVGDRNFVTELTIQRQGTNDDIHEGLVETNAGKSIKSMR